MAEHLEAAEARAQTIARKIASMMPDGWIFVLSMFKADDPKGTASYVSNCNRADAIVALRGVADKMERKSEI